MDNNSDIIVFSSVKTIKFDFKHKPLELKTFTVQQIFNECSIFALVNISGLYNLQNKTFTSKDGRLLRLKEGMIKDE